MSYSFNTVSQLQPQSPVVQQWETLQTSCVDANFYHDWRWHSALKTHLIPNMQWAVSYFEGNLIAVVPFIYDESTRLLAFPSHLQIDLFDVTLSPQHLNPQWFEALMSFFNTEFSPWQYFRANPVLESSAIYQLYKQYLGLKHSDPYLKNTFFDVQDNKALVKLSKKHLKNVNRLGRKLAKDVAEPIFEHGASLPTSLEAFLSIEHQSWKGQPDENTSILSSKALTAFYKQVAESFNETDDCFISLCKSNDEYIAGQLGISTQSRLSMVKIGYDARYHPYAPGNQLMAETLAYVAHSSLSEVNLVTGPSWADRWHPQTQSVFWLTFYNNNTAGKFAYTWARLKDTLRPLLQHIKSKGK